MLRTTFFEEEGYVLYCMATHLGNGEWESSVIFERKSDQESAIVPSIRHITRDIRFQSESDAIARAYQHGLELIQTNKVGLD
ncbi:hypothetical protein ACIPLR_12415 [Herbaspirillum huttiense]|uniref:hypothetical protein n=1 Tax=Herbaspirillum huttiense TaxID=863372 RepID=UPI003812432B